ncbi:MAG: serine hydrolase [Flavobacterium sp.]|jgi:beta-glucosidase-like glycosyl hydrolase/CubicO group peptidase (beta-lactamase class C family)|uniref:glycoside hydrolase family 3 N-terminal domain-containing protein n=1 Tax=Flavobacterium sp. TaxID=239 RepID=UPI001B740C4C|nr:glycoside hydrolase family 3 N-terminal domain-containing protein [Flavobacterium sp.]MBP6146949.1 serine hydrolase [Flavobacterium sp.]MBP7183128.1 serine hydrolase [Flavobacterium sp.]MBP7318200.1 serine hydrolase [Flavobacterium sp.]MBP8888110.1 serine hydrolase [Flavobacterium sp.]HRM46997.1 glycoside hydrolase family 3 N-terminal domain-containing protein [Flavobacterium sp.]
MKKIGIKIVFFNVLFLFVATACVGTKINKEKVLVTNIPSKKENLDSIKYSNLPTLFDLAPEGNKWVDSVYNTLALEEKFGQLFMVAAYSNKDFAHYNAIDKLIQENKIGGLIFFQGGPVRQAKLTNRFQSKSKIPLFIGIDAEWGLGMRLDSTYRYPWNMTLGAIQDMNLLEKVGVQMGEQSKRLGLQFNFAPVLDINTNPKNPIIGFRSFGEDKFKVTERAIALMKGFQSQGVFSTGKHFPGHGDTETDSHKSLPTIHFSKERLSEVELYPYRKMFHDGLSSVMVAHLKVPSLEPRSNYPSSISYNVVTDILQKELGFKGLIFTDALNMKSVSNFKLPSEINFEAFMAGNDVLLFPADIPSTIEKFKLAYSANLFSEERLAFSVKKILKFKYKAGLNSYKPIVIDNLYTDLNSSKNDALQYELYENAVTVLKNTTAILPIKNLDKQKIAYVKIGDDSNDAFVSTLKKYAEVTVVEDANLDSLQVKLKPFTTVIIGYHKSDVAFKDDDLKSNDLYKINFLAKNNNVILDVFAKPYSLLPITNFDAIEGLVVSYQNNAIAQIVSAELIFGAIEAKGKLPVSIHTSFKVNDGFSTEKLSRLGFSSPENVGMNAEILSKIDGIANKAINGKMTPGIQVLVARKGKVIYQKSFGYHTYDKTIKVQNSDIYDVASLTKIMATLPNVMVQYDHQKINLETTLGTMLPIFKNSNKATINFKDLLSHYAGLAAGIPFYKATMDKSSFPSEVYFRKISEEQFSKKMADSLFIRNDFCDTIMKMIVKSKIALKKEYKYSDLTFMILKDYLEKTTSKTLDVLIQENFYRSLGMNNSSFNPLEKFDKNRIPPTENDTYFRRQLLQGYVNDLSAALEGGVSGHAGVFSNAMDVAKIMQLYLQKGKYGDQQYFSEKTFDDFNTCYFCAAGNRRGVGFDKPQLGAEGPTCGCASMTSFGHTGYTGTMAWADPDAQIVYVFLSNRTFPIAGTNRLSKENIREDIQKVIYEAIQN